MDTIATVLARGGVDGYPPLSPGGIGIVVSNVIMFVLPTIWTGMRIWSRTKKGVSFLLVEDLFCYMAWLFNTGSNVNFSMLAVVGAGHHIADVVVNPEAIVLISKLMFAGQVIYAITLGCVKISILWMMQRIFSVPHFRYISYALISLCVAWMLQVILTGILLCQPTSLNWDPTARGSCGNQQLAYSLVSIVDIIIDLFILILPMHMVAKLQVDKVHKIALYAIFSVGGITIIITAIRLAFIWNVDFNDITYSSTNTFILNTIQTGIAVMVTSSPLLRPVFDRTIGHWLKLSLRSTRNNSEPKLSNHQNGNLITIGRSGAKGFKQMGDGDSEEHLRWELSEVGTQKSTGREVAIGRGSEEDAIGRMERGPRNGVLVTTETSVS